MNLSQNARFALVIAEAVKNNYWQADQTQWANFVANIRKNAQPPVGSLTIHENVWQIPLANGIPFLGKLVEVAEEMNIPLRILFLDATPDWIKCPPDGSPQSQRTAGPS